MQSSDLPPMADSLLSRRRLGVAVLLAALIIPTVMWSGVAAAPDYEPIVLQPLVPARLLETRLGAGLITVDGQFQGIGRRAAGSTVEVLVAGRGGVPASASAVMLNVTAVKPSVNGYLTVFPCGTVMPVASSVNYAPGDVVPNAVLAKIGDGGKVCIFTLADTDLIVDVNAAVVGATAVTPLVPVRLLESRVGPGMITVDGQLQGIGRRSAGSVVEVLVAGRGGVAASASAVMLNVTAVKPSGNGYLTVFPCGTAMPVASSVNYAPGDVVPNAVLAKIGDGGKVCIFTLADTDLIVDVNGSTTQSPALIPMVPARLLETRSGPQNLTVDAQFQGIGRRPVSSTLELVVVGRAGIPSIATAVMLNVTAIKPSAAGFLTVFPCGGVMPQASNVNYVPGDVVANSVLAKIGADGKVCIFTIADTDLVVDVNAFIVYAPPMSNDGNLTPTQPGVFGRLPVAPPQSLVESLVAGVGDLESGPPASGLAHQSRPAMDLAATDSADHWFALESGFAPVRSADGQRLPEFVINEPIYGMNSVGYTTVGTGVGRLFLWRWDGVDYVQESSCSGTVVGGSMVLTAGHCLTDAAGVWWDYYSFVPGLVGLKAPAGEWWAAPDRAYRPNGFLASPPADRIAYDYGLVKFDATENDGLLLSDHVDDYGIYLDAALEVPTLVTAGYPGEGYFDLENDGWCSAGFEWCFPYQCSSNDGAWVEIGDRAAVGMGCSMNGGMSGAGIFGQIEGNWYVTSVVSRGGELRDINDVPCADRELCNWYMSNAWGPVLQAGYFDAFYDAVAAL